MKKYIVIFISVFAAVLAVVYFSGAFKVNCHAHNHAHKHDHGHDHGHAHDQGSEEGVHLTPEQMKHVKITVSKAAVSNVKQTLTLHGEIKLNADRTAKIMQRVPGFVTGVFAKQGDKVKAGTLLARLNSEKLGEHYSNYYSSKALEEVALSEYKMASRLYANKAMAEKDYLRYKRDYIDSCIARRKAETVLHSLELDHEHKSHSHSKNFKEVICTEYDVVSPIDGTIIGKDIAPGEKYADDNTQVLFLVSDLDKLWLELRADYQELKQISAGMPVAVTPLGGGKSVSGKITYVSQVVDEASRKGFVRAEIDNCGGKLRSGEFATGTVVLDTGRKAVVVPREAVQLVAGENVVFVPVKDAFVTRVVTTGAAEGSNIEIVSGLSAGEAFVSEGAFTLKSVMLTAGMDPHAGHGH